MIRSRRGADPRDKLNDLSGKEWLQLSRSWWFQKGLGRSHPEASIGALHPVPFSFHDIRKMIRVFTKHGMTVLDPFCGDASTLEAAALCERNAIALRFPRNGSSLESCVSRRRYPLRCVLRSVYASFRETA